MENMILCIWKSRVISKSEKCYPFNGRIVSKFHMISNTIMRCIFQTSINLMFLDGHQLALNFDWDVLDWFCIRQINANQLIRKAESNKQWLDWLMFFKQIWFQTLFSYFIEKCITIKTFFLTYLVVNTLVLLCKLSFFEIVQFFCHVEKMKKLRSTDIIEFNTFKVCNSLEEKYELKN